MAIKSKADLIDKGKANCHFAICIPCYNEEDNLPILYERLCRTLDRLPEDRFSIVFGDNCSTDRSVEFITGLMSSDTRIGLIENEANFGFVRSSANVLLAPDADANIFLMCDLQDPPELIELMVRKWKTSTNQVIFGTRRSSNENKILFICKKAYYTLLAWMSDYPMVRDSTGFGIYSRSTIQALRDSIDSYPFIKGLVCAIGVKWGTISYKSSNREAGKSSASLGFLVDFGILGIVTSSRKPMRIITTGGLLLGTASIALAVVVVATKLANWDGFQFGLAMVSVTSLFFTGAIMFALGILGEYIGFINQRSLRLPLVVERRRQNIP